MQSADGRYEPCKRGHTEYVDAIKEDIRWLGYDWDDRFFYGSDYFEQTYEFAVGLIKKDSPIYASSARRNSKKTAAIL
jgi:glutamyl/glutaminyl-tRNA synthetase